MTETRPRLSVVVTTRNDNHGGNPLGRFQAFVNCLTAQCRRTGLSAELIVVEWNPPPDRPPLAEALRWPEDSPCDVRIIQVPPALHGTLKHADGLPLFQMIAKNVGIRRARGEFVLSTNIDILPTNELVDYIAGGRLQPGCLYRIDRHDVDPDLPIDAPLDEMMAYCRTHQIRKHTRWGSFPIDPAGQPVLFTPDVVPADAGIRFGEGWHVREGSPELMYRWASGRAEVLLDKGIDAGRLNVEFESDPYDPASAIEISVAADDGTPVLAPTPVAGCLLVQLVIPKGVSRRLWFTVRATSDSPERRPVFEDRDGLVFRVRRMWWEAGGFGALDVRVDWPYPAEGWRPSDGSGARVDVTPSEASVISGTRSLSYAAEYQTLVAPAAGTYRFWLTLSFEDGDAIVQALNGDRLKFLANSTDVRTGGGRRVCALSVPLEAGQSFFIVTSNLHESAGMPSRFTIHDMVADRPFESLLPQPAKADVLPEPTPPLAGGEPADAVTSFGGRVVRGVARRVRTVIGPRPPAVERVVERIVEPPPGYEDLLTAYRLLAPLARLAPLGYLRDFLSTVRPERLHTNACGDFQLAARDDWFELRGFAEFELYSMNIDALFCHTAHYGGLREHIFHYPECAYHIEHDLGSGWTPEGETRLRQRIAERGIGWLDNALVSMLASFMKWVGRPMIFNGSDWGFSRHTLPETVLESRSKSWKIVS